jgi:hypothetical protein
MSKRENNNKFSHSTSRLKENLQHQVDNLSLNRDRRKAESPMKAVPSSSTKKKLNNNLSGMNETINLATLEDNPVQTTEKELKICTQENKM